MPHQDVRTLLTAGQAAAVLHRSASTVSHWAKDGKLPIAARVAVGRGIYLFDPEVIKEKAMELALGPDRGDTLDLEEAEPKRRKAS